MPEGLIGAEVLVSAKLFLAHTKRWPPGKLIASMSQTLNTECILLLFLQSMLDPQSEELLIDKSKLGFYPQTILRRAGLGS